MIAIRTLAAESGVQESIISDLAQKLGLSISVADAATKQNAVSEEDAARIRAALMAERVAAVGLPIKTEAQAEDLREAHGLPRKLSAIPSGEPVTDASDA